MALQTAQSTSQTSPTHMDVAPAIDEKFWENMQGSSWFSSDNINYAMFILSRQYPSIDGLGNCEFLSHAGTYTTTPTPAQRFIQIINVNNNHWITLSNMLCGPGQVQVYDSFNVTLSNVDIRNISYICRKFSIKSKLNHLVIVREPVQQQTGIRLRSSGHSVCLHLGWWSRPCNNIL